MTRWFVPLAAALLSGGVLAQDTDALRRELERERAENRRLRERLEVLQREEARTPDGTPATEEAATGEDGNRALERALVREGGLLLPQRTREFEVNAVYSRTELGAAFARDAFGPGLVLRLGLPSRTQLELGLPYVSERRRVGDATSSASGFGDLSVAVAHQLLAEGRAPFGLIGSLAWQASTGRNTLGTPGGTVGLGAGFDTVQASLVAVRRADPLVFFGSYGVSHAFPETRGGARVEPGLVHGLRFGTALAASPTTSLRTAMSLRFAGRTRIDGAPVPGSDDPGAALEIGASAVLGPRTALDVAVSAGLTRNVPDYRIAVALPMRF